MKMFSLMMISYWTPQMHEWVLLFFIAKKLSKLYGNRKKILLHGSFFFLIWALTFSESSVSCSGRRSLGCCSIGGWSWRRVNKTPLLKWSRLHCRETRSPQQLQKTRWFLFDLPLAIVFFFKTIFSRISLSFSKRSLSLSLLLSGSLCWLAVMQRKFGFRLRLRLRLRLRYIYFNRIAEK